MGGPHYVHGAALGARGHLGHQGDHGDAPLQQVRAHEGVLRLRCSEGPILQQRLHRSAGPRQRATARVPALHREIIERHKEGARNRLFIDEVQLCEGFEKAINSIHARGGWDIYLTGSNAFLLSSDLATLFTGRHGEVHILPFSFGEYRSYFDEQGGRRRRLRRIHQAQRARRVLRLR